MNHRARRRSWVAWFMVAAATFALPISVQGQTGETVEYYGLDAVGSVRIVFSPTGTVVARMDYGPFGDELVASAGLAQDRFAQLFRDGEAGLDYAKARAYQIRTGRFTTPDPVYAGLFEPQRWNRYSYALNSPLMFVDPSGLQAGCTWTEVNVEGGVSTQLTCPTNTGSPLSTIGEALSDFRDFMLWLLINSLDVVLFTGPVEAPSANGVLTPGPAYRPSQEVEEAVNTGLTAVAIFVPGAAGKTTVAKTVARRTASRLPTTPKAGPRDPFHHIFSQRTDLAAQFQARGITPHDFTMQIPGSIHQQIHSGGPRGGAWNQAWDEFFKANPNATAVDVYKEAGRLIHQFQLPGGPVVPYRR